MMRVPRSSWMPALPAARASHGLSVGLLIALVLMGAATVPLDAAAERGGGEAEAGPFEHLSWRPIGPVNMSGRVTAVEGVPGDPNVVYVGAASGGVWKTVDGGLTFEPVFDEQPIASIGALALAPSNPDVVYAGTGESSVRNSVSYGNGVYKSTDGGGSWRHLGLEETRHISRVVVHPRDPDTVFVAALGSIYGPGEERGVFRSRDGGASWEKVLYLDELHGAADLDMDPSNPNILFATLWHFQRKPWTFTSGSEEGGLWRSVDGGESWEKVEEGLPKLAGRMGVRLAPSDPEVVYVIAESNEGTLFRSEDRGESFRKVSDDPDIVSRGFYYTHVLVDPQDANRVYAIASRLFVSIDGGKSFRRISRSTHVDYHALWADPANPARLWQGQDGGVAVSYDRGETWDPLRNLPIGQFYQVYADERRPFYYTGGGLQDNGTWYGPSRTREPAGILEDDWRMVSFGDAYWVVPHPENPDLLISESQAGGIVRTDMSTRRQVSISPQPERNDGGPVEELTYRFNWNAPIVASPHEPTTVYFAGNVVFRSRDFGSSWEVISPDLTTDDPEKQKTAGGPVWEENTTAEYHCTIISFAESPVREGVLWAGTDDGNLQLSRDGGESWTDVVGNVPGLPAFSPVSHVEPSRTAAGTAYAAFDRHMFDDLGPHVYKTTDFGATWRRLGEGIPDGAYVWVLREDPVNTDLLYAGTELGLYASWDGGAHFRRLHLENLPTVAVHDIRVQPRENDLILGTHGRSIWIFDDATPIQRYPEVEGAEAAHLLPPRPALRFPARFTRYGLGDRLHKAPNPPYGALITYYLPESLEPEEGTAGGDGEEAREASKGTEEGGREAGMKQEQEERIGLEILDASGAVIRTLEAEGLGKKAGFNRVAWDLAADPPTPRDPSEDEGGEFWGPPRGASVLPGTYIVRLTVDGESREQPVEVGIDPLVEVTREALEAEHRVASRLSAMRSTVNRALRSLDTLTAELAAREATLELLERQVPQELAEPWEEFGGALEELIGRLARDEEAPGWSQGPELVDRLGDLARDVDGAFAAPTAAQMEYFRRLEGEYAEAEAAVSRFFTGAVPAFNQALAAHGIPPLTVPEPVAVE